MIIFLGDGGNVGTCGSLAQTVVIAASSYGYGVHVQPLDDATKNIPKDQRILLIVFSHEGQPPDNACRFIERIEKAEEKPLSGVSYAIFGCGNRTLALRTISLL